MAPAAQRARAKKQAPLPRPSGREYVKVYRSGLHGRGLFAARFLPKGTPIVEYRGEKVGKREGQRRAAIQEARGRTYVFTLNDRYDLDGSPQWNTARLANASCDPNAESLYERGRIWIYATRDIAAGEEITYDYHFDFDGDPKPCLCGSSDCIGYLVSGRQLRRLCNWLQKEGRPVPPGLTKRLRKRSRR